MNILVTGGAGYIGSHTVLELLQKNIEVIVVDNLSNGSFESIKRIETLTNKSVVFYEVDCMDYDRLNQIFKDHNIDGVIHFAGLKAVGESVIKPLKYYKNNIISTLVLLEVMLKNQVNAIVFSSSATVYGPNNPSPLIETMSREAINPYGQTKIIIEDILRDIALSNPNFSVCALRYFNPVGAHKSGLIGENPLGTPNNLMPFITQVAVQRQKELAIFGDDYDTPDGTGIRDYIHVVDLAKGHIKALDFVMKKTGFEAINLGTGKGISVKELVSIFAKTNDVVIPIKITTRRAGDLAVCYADVKKAKEVLNFETELNTQDMVKDAWNFQKRNPQGY